MMQWIYINILFIVIIFLQNEHMLNRYKLDFIISGFGGLLLTTDSYRSTTTYYCIKNWRVTVILVRTSCWWLFQCNKSVNIISNWWPTSPTGHQHISSPTSIQPETIVPYLYTNMSRVFHRIFNKGNLFPLSLFSSRAIKIRQNWETEFFLHTEKNIQFYPASAGLLEFAFAQLEQLLEHTT